MKVMTTEVMEVGLPDEMVCEPSFPKPKRVSSSLLEPILLIQENAGQ